MTSEQLLQLVRELCQRYGYIAEIVPEGAKNLVIKTPAGKEIELSLHPETGRWAQYQYLKVKDPNAPDKYRLSYAWHSLGEAETVYPESVEIAIRTNILNRPN